MANRVRTAWRTLKATGAELFRRDPGGLFQFGESNLVDPPSNRLGTADATPAKPAPGTIVKAQVAERWINQVSRGLTPEAVDDYLTAAISGDAVNQFALFEEMEEKCPELRLPLYKHKLKAARRNPRINPPDRPFDPALAKRKADFADAAFDGVRDWHRTAFNLMDAVGKGISAAEIIWRMAEFGGKPAVMIDEMPWVNHRHLGWWWDKPELQLFPDLRNRALHIDVPPRKFIVFHHLSKSGHASRAGMLRPLSWLFLIYLYAMKDWSTLAETYGIDVAHAFCKTGATTEERQKILMHLSRLAARAGVFDEGTVINLQRAAAGGSAPQEGLINYVRDQMITAFLGSTLGTSSGEKGARSLGLVQQDETEELVDWTCLLFGGTMTNTALRWLMDFNFAETGDNPVMELPGANRRDLAALANVINILVNLGVRVPEAWCHSQFDIPEPKPLGPDSQGDDGAELERILMPSKAASSLKDPNPDSTQTEGESLTGRALLPAEGITGYSTVTEHKFQRALDEIRKRAVLEGKDTGAFDQIADPIKRIVFGDGTAAEKMAMLHNTVAGIDPAKLAGVGREIIILADLCARASIGEHTAVAHG